MMGNILPFRRKEDISDLPSTWAPFKPGAESGAREDGYHDSPPGMTNGMDLLNYFETCVVDDGFSSEGMKSWDIAVKEIREQRESEATNDTNKGAA